MTKRLSERLESSDRITALSELIRRVVCARVTARKLISVVERQMKETFELVAAFY